jgi:hypothetical protein
VGSARQSVTSMRSLDMTRVGPWWTPTREVRIVTNAASGNVCPVWGRPGAVISIGPKIRGRTLPDHPDPALASGVCAEQ